MYTKVYTCLPDIEHFLIGIYRVNKKTGISGILADFCNFFLQPVMAANIIENFEIFDFFLLFQEGQKKLAT